MNFDLILDQTLFVYCQLAGRMVIKVAFRLYTHCTGMCTILKSNTVKTHDQSNN